jgi:hypothetical protein
MRVSTALGCNPDADSKLRLQTTSVRGQVEKQISAVSFQNARGFFPARCTGRLVKERRQVWPSWILPDGCAQGEALGEELGFVAAPVSHVRMSASRIGAT